MINNRVLVSKAADLLQKPHQNLSATMIHDLIVPSHIPSHGSDSSDFHDNNNDQFWQFVGLLACLHQEKIISIPLEDITVKMATGNLDARFTRKQVNYYLSKYRSTKEFSDISLVGAWPMNFNFADESIVASAAMVEQSSDSDNSNHNKAEKKSKKNRKKAYKKKTKNVRKRKTKLVQNTKTKKKITRTKLPHLTQITLTQFANASPLTGSVRRSERLKKQKIRMAVEKCMFNFRNSFFFYRRYD